VRQMGNFTESSVSWFIEPFRQGGSGMLSEYRLYGLRWGFSFEEVSQQIAMRVRRVS
jgi:hypothetical protein